MRYTVDRYRVYNILTDKRSERFLCLFSFLNFDRTKEFVGRTNLFFFFCKRFFFTVAIPIPHFKRQLLCRWLSEQTKQ